MDFISYFPFLWLLLIPPMLVAFIFTLVDRPPVRKWAAFLLRVLGMILLVLALCRPFYSRSSSLTHTIYLVDVSESVDLKAVGKTAKRIEELSGKLRPGDTWAMYYLADSVKRITPKEFPKLVEEWRQGMGDAEFRRESRIADALTGSRLAIPAGKSGKIVLFSDGQNTAGNLDDAVENLEKAGITLEFAKLPGLDRPEAAVLSLTPNTPEVYAGEILRLTAKLTANRDIKGKLRFINRGVVIKEVPVELKAGKISEIPADFPVKTDEGGRWQVELQPEKDYFPVNNHASCQVKLRGPAKVLALHEKPAKLRNFARAMKSQDIDVEIRGKFGMPTTMAELLQFDAVLIASLPAEILTTQQMKNVKRFVSDFGRGLIMTGSENSFGLGGYYRTPVEEVLPLNSRYEKEKEQPSLAMVLVIDKSGSMNGIKISLARQAAKAAVELLNPRDQVGVVAFDGQPFTVCEMTPAVNTSAINSAIDQIGAGGGTNMYPAMASGKELLDNVSAKIKHMIVLTDGMSSGGDFEGIASEMADSGMTISTVALGQGAARELLNRIAEIGRGRYYETVDPESVPRIFTGETIEASKSAIREEPFQPVKIGDADFVSGIDFSKSPFLLGYVKTRIKPTARAQLITETGDPLLASGQYGLGRSVAFTSGLTGDWAGEWLDWKNYGKFWSQVVRAVLPPDATAGFTTKFSENNGTGTVNIERKNSSGEPLNNIKWKAEMITGNGVKTSLDMTETGNGRYQSKFAIPESQGYLLRFADQTHNKLKVIHKSWNYPREFLLYTKAPESLNKLPAPGKSPAPPSVPARRSALPIYGILAIIFIALGIFFRRI